MIDPLFLVLLVVYCGAIARATPVWHRPVRLVAATLPGIFLLIYTNIFSIQLALFISVFSSAIFMVCRKLSGSRLRSGLPYIILLLIFVPDAMQWQQGGALLLLGSAFYIVRQFMTVKDALREERATR